MQRVTYLSPQAFCLVSQDNRLCTALAIIDCCQPHQWIYKWRVSMAKILANPDKSKALTDVCLGTDMGTSDTTDVLSTLLGSTLVKLGSALDSRTKTLTGPDLVLVNVSWPSTCLIVGA